MFFKDAWKGWCKKKVDLIAKKLTFIKILNVLAWMSNLDKDKIGVKLVIYTLICIHEHNESWNIPNNGKGNYLH